MPHIIIEHCAETEKSTDLKKLAQKLHQTLAAQESIKIESLKTRTLLTQNVQVGDSTQVNFLHITVKLLQGRSEELRKVMAQRLFDQAHKMLSQPTSLSVEVVELQTYVKQ